MKQKKSESSRLCAHEELTDVVWWDRDSSLSFLGGCDSHSSGEVRVGLISLVLLSKSGISALGWLFKISLVTPWFSGSRAALSGDRWASPDVSSCPPIQMWDTGDAQLCPHSKVLHKCLDGLLGLCWLSRQWVTYGVLGKFKSVAELLIAVENGEIPLQARGVWLWKLWTSESGEK